MWDRYLQIKAVANQAVYPVAKQSATNGLLLDYFLDPRPIFRSEGFLFYMSMPQNNLQPIKRAMAIEEEEISFRKFMKKASIEKNDIEVAYMDLLPDEILSLIISFLTTRDVVRTSVLATKWRFLCASPCNLNFDWPNLLGWKKTGYRCGTWEDSYEGSKHLFVKIVDQILNNYVGTRILTFRISFCLRREFSCEIDRWICFAVKLGVENLNLHFSCNHFLRKYAAEKSTENKHKEYYIFPCHLLPCGKESMLKQLFLQSCILGPDLNDRFTSLVTLKLYDVPLSQSYTDTIVFSCLNLECLNLERCSILVPRLSVCSLLRLKSLAVFYCSEVKEIELSASKLTSFEYGGNLVKFSFLEVPNLEKLHFWVECAGSLGYIFSQLGKVVPHVKALLVFTPLNWVKHIPECLTTFSKVKQLELYFCAPTMFHVPKIFAILQACPVLQKFHLVGNPRRFGSDTYEVGEFQHNHLKEVEVGGFYGTEAQIGFLMQLVKYAVMLERMVVTVDAEVRRENQSCAWDSDMHPRMNSHVLANILRERATSKKAVIILLWR